MVIQLTRFEDGSRRVVSVQEIEGMEGDVITMSEIFKYMRSGVSDDGLVLGEFCATGVVPKCIGLMKQKGLKVDMSVFSQNLT